MFTNLRRANSGIIPSSNSSSISERSRPRSSHRRGSRDLIYDFRSPTDTEHEPSPEPEASQTKLTQTLLDSTTSGFEAATQQPFLRLAGRGKLSKKDLSRWLSQDRLYAEAYINFIASLIARVTLPYTYISDKSKSLRWRIVKILTGCLENIHREIDFFTETAQQYDLRLDHPFAEIMDEFGPNPVTDSYLSLFHSFRLDPQQTLLEGLLVLWATEKCYLDAWRYASRFAPQDTSTDQDADGGALRSQFIPNWSSPEFDKFVQDIAEVTDELAAREGALKKIEVYRALWLHVLKIEKGFWPEVDEN